MNLNLSETYPQTWNNFHEECRNARRQHEVDELKFNQHLREMVNVLV